MKQVEKRNWTLQTARALIGDVRARTAEAVESTNLLFAECELLDEGTPDRQAVDAKIEAVISSWARAMEALGLEVKGVWLVDFDNGNGYYCWKWPEQGLEYFHGYEDGFAGRTRIQ